MCKFSVIDAPSRLAESCEPLGTKPKFWFRHPQLGRCLCKITRPGTGEDWSEKVAAEVASALMLPCATYELGVSDGQSCVVSPLFVPFGCTLVHGNELLGQSDPLYGGISFVSRFRLSAHTPGSVADALHRAGCEMPIDWTPPEGIGTALDVFAGYLMLDAVIGNTDRHHENWALIETPSDAPAGRYLAPTFDHASCLGCHLRDDERQRRLKTRDRAYSVEAYADRARSAFYERTEAARPLAPLDAFVALARVRPGAGRVWLRILQSVNADQFSGILERLPLNASPKRPLSSRCEFSCTIETGC